MYHSEKRSNIHIIAKTEKMYSLLLDSDAVATGRMTTPFDICAKPEVLVVTLVCSLLVQTPAMLETLDDNVGE